MTYTELCNWLSAYLFAHRLPSNAAAVKEGDPHQLICNTNKMSTKEIQQLKESWNQNLK